ncbi:MAG: hypothetical protein CL917_04500 [Deltaproteobacteria bacterium]|nr:hypothetical protein [Deltaproteobacteria bacterium]
MSTSFRSPDFVFLFFFVSFLSFVLSRFNFQPAKSLRRRSSKNPSEGFISHFSSTPNPFNRVNDIKSTQGLHSYIHTKVRSTGIHRSAKRSA